MGVFSRLTGKSRKPTAVQNNRIVRASVRRGEELIRHYAALDPERAKMLLLAGQGEFYSTADKIATVASACPLRLFRAVGGATGAKRRRKSLVSTKAAEYEDIGEVEEERNHPALDFIRKPNPYMTGNEFDRYRFLSMLVAGDCFMYVDKPEGGVPAWGMGLSPAYVRIVPSKERLVDHYLYGRESDGVPTLTPDEVVRWKYAPTLDETWEAAPPAMAIWRDLQTLIYGSSAELVRWEEGSHPGLVISLDPSVTQTQADQIDAEFDKYRGAENAGRDMIIQGGVGVDFADHSPDKVMFAEGMRFIHETIWRRLNVPEAIAKMNDANLASASAGYHQFTKMCIEPLLTKDADVLNEQLLPMFGDDGLFFAYDSPVPQDDQLLIQRSTLIGKGISLNEWRAEAGYDPSEDRDADDPMIEVASALPGFLSSRAPVALPSGEGDDSEDGIQDETPAAGQDMQSLALNGAQIAELQNMAQQVALGQLPPNAARELMLAAFPSIDPARVDKIIGAMSGFVPRPGPEDADALQARSARRIAKASLSEPSATCCEGHATKDIDPDNPQIPDEQVRISESLARRVDRWYRSQLVPSLATAGTDYSVPDSLVQSLAEAMEPDFRRLWDAGVDVAAGELGGDTRIPDEAANAFMQGYLNDLSTGILRTDAERVRGALQPGIESGASIRTMRDAIVEEYDGNISRSRAETIARTESQYVVNEAGRRQAKESGFTHKSWLVAPGNCPLCARLVQDRGGKIPTDEPFYKAGTTVVGTDGRTFTTNRDVLAPPLHPRCRCTVLYHEEGDQ